MRKDNYSLTKYDTASDSAMVLVDKYTNGKLSMGEYAHKLVEETYLNLISQAQSGQILCIEGQTLDIKIGSPHQIFDTNNYKNEYQIGRFTISYQQDTPAIGSEYNENADLTIAIDQEWIYSGAFKNVSQKELNILEKCLKFSALNYDLFLDKNMLIEFSKVLKQFNDLLLLEDGGPKL